MSSTILIIDDDHNLCTNLTTLLQSFNYNIHIANLGYDGLNKANSVFPDLIICDMMMPDLSGFEILRKLSENESTKKIPFFFLSAVADPREISKAYDLGASNYITKPFRAKPLLELINKTLLKE